MRNFIKNIALLLVMLSLFSFTALAELGKGNDLDVGNSIGVIVPIPNDKTEDEQYDTPMGDNNSSGGGNSYRTGIKLTYKNEK